MDCAKPSQPVPAAASAKRSVRAQGSQLALARSGPAAFRSACRQELRRSTATAHRPQISRAARRSRSAHLLISLATAHRQTIYSSSLWLCCCFPAFGAGPRGTAASTCRPRASRKHSEHPSPRKLIESAANAIPAQFFFSFRHRFGSAHSLDPPARRPVAPRRGPLARGSLQGRAAVAHDLHRCSLPGRLCCSFPPFAQQLRREHASPGVRNGSTALTASLSLSLRHPRCGSALRCQPSAHSSVAHQR